MDVEVDAARREVYMRKMKKLNEEEEVREIPDSSFLHFSPALVPLPVTDHSPDPGCQGGRGSTGRRFGAKWKSFLKAPATHGGVEAISFVATEGG